MSERAWYSLIQYVPRLDRGEGANVGLLLYSPAHDFVHIQVSESNERIKRLFGKGSYDPERMKLAKRAIARRIESEAREVRSVDELRRVLRREGNQLQFTPLHEIAVKEPDVTFRQLFAELVGQDVPRSEKRPQRLPELQLVAERLERRAPVKRDVKVDVPELGQSLRADLAYQNGVRNLVKGQLFGQKALDKAAQLASQGLLLAKGGAGEPYRLTIVSKVDDPKLAPHVKRILELHEVRCVAVEDVEALEAEILRDAH